MDQPPPPYAAQQGANAPEADAVVIEDASLEAQRALNNIARLTSTGRVDVELDARLSRIINNFLPAPPSRYSTNDSLQSSQSVQSVTRSTPAKLNIVIHVVGSRGDVQPFIALGTELQKWGHRVRLATHNVFEDFVLQAGLEFYPIGGDPKDLMSYMVKNPGLLPSVETMRKGEIRKKRNMVLEMLDGCWMSCLEPDPKTKRPFVADAIIANPPSFAHVHCAQALSIPLHLMFTMPWTATRAFPHPLANILDGGDNAGMVNYLSYGILDWMTWQGLGDVINSWRRKLDLEPLSATTAVDLVNSLQIPFTYCWSPSLVPKPKDWPKHIDVCGFFFRDPPAYKPTAELDRFLQAGPPPVYIGFGSIVIDDPEKLTQTLLGAVKKAGVRALISKGWSKLGNTEASEDVFFLDDCPHEWLFKHVSAVVHHGGAGTTACGLLNCKPTIVVPFFGDQPFWGSMIAAAGAGPNPIPPQNLSADSLATAIKFCLKPEVLSAAKSLGAKMQREQGVKAAVVSFHRRLPKTRLPCNLLPEYTATRTYKTKGRLFMLSELATALLVKHGRVDLKGLKTYQVNPYEIKEKSRDVLTGFTAATVGTAADLVGALGSVLINPVTEYKLAAANRRDGGAGGASPSKAAVHASIKSIGRVPETLIKSGGVGIPVAVATGFRSMARACGDRVREHDPVTDWKSGAMVAGKGLVLDVYDGVTGVVLQPYRGAKEDGVLGAIKGFSGWTVGMPIKICGSLAGLVAYPVQGVYKSIRTATHSKARKAISAARNAEGEHLLKHETQSIDVDSILKRFDTMTAVSSPIKKVGNEQTQRTPRTEQSEQSEQSEQAQQTEQIEQTEQHAKQSTTS